MTIKTASDETQKVTISLPRSILQRLDELVPARQRSRFIAEALAERLGLAEQLLALEESAGAWSDANHPELADDAAIDRWLAELRRSWTMPEGGDHLVTLNPGDFQVMPGLSLYRLDEQRLV